MAFLGIPIQHDCGRLISDIDVPGDKVPINDYHVSLFYFEYDIAISDLSKIIEPTFNISSKQKPFIVTLELLSCFDSNKERYPIIGKIDCPELNSLRNKIKKSYNKFKIGYNKDFKTFQPHITLSYNSEKFEDVRIDKVQFIVNELVLWGGDNRR